MPLIVSLRVLFRRCIRSNTEINRADQICFPAGTTTRFANLESDLISNEDQGTRMISACEVLQNLVSTSDNSVPIRSRHLVRKLLLGTAVGALAYLVLLPMHGPWEGMVAAALVGSVVGIADLSVRRILVGSIACSVGWLIGSILFGVWIELGIGAWVLAGAFLGAAFGVARKWWTAIAGIFLGSIAGAVIEVSRYLTVLLPPLRGADMQLLLLLSAGMFLNLVGALVSPLPRRASAGS